MDRKKKLFIAVWSLCAVLATASNGQAQVTAKLTGNTLRFTTSGLNNEIVVQGLGPGHLQATYGGQTYEWTGVKNININPASKNMGDFPRVYVDDLRISGNFSCSALVCELDNCIVDGNCGLEAVFLLSVLDTQVKKNLSLENNGGSNFTLFPQEELTVINCIVDGNAKVNGNAGIVVGDSLFKKNLNISLEGDLLYLLGNAVVRNMSLDGGPNQGVLFELSPTIVLGKIKLKRFSNIPN